MGETDMNRFDNGETMGDIFKKCWFYKEYEVFRMVPETTALSTELQVHNEKHNF